MGDPVPARRGGRPDPGVEELTDAWVATIHARGFVSAGRAELYSVLFGAAWWTSAVVDGRAEIETALDEATKRFGEDVSDGGFAEQQRLFEAKQSYNDRLASLASSD